MGLFDGFAAAFENEDLSRPDSRAGAAALEQAELYGSRWRCDLSVVGLSTAADPSADLYGQRTSVVASKHFQKRVEAAVEVVLHEGGEASVADTQLTCSAPRGRWWLVGGSELHLQCATPGVVLTSSWKTDTGNLESLGSSSMEVPPGLLFLRGRLERFGTRATVPAGSVQVRVEKGRFNTFFKEAGTWEASGDLVVR